MKYARLFLDGLSILDNVIEEICEMRDLKIDLKIKDKKIVLTGFKYELTVKEFYYKDGNDENDVFYCITELGTIENVVAILKVLEKRFPEKIDIDSIIERYNLLKSEVINQVTLDSELSDIIYFLETSNG